MGIVDIPKTANKSLTPGMSPAAITVRIASFPVIKALARGSLVLLVPPLLGIEISVSIDNP